MCASSLRISDAHSGMGGKRSAVPNARLDEVRQKLSQQAGQGAIPLNFSPTAPAHDPEAPQQRGRMPQQAVRNPQTEQLLSMLDLPYNLDQRRKTAPGQGDTCFFRCHTSMCQLEMACSHFTVDILFVRVLSHHA